MEAQNNVDNGKTTAIVSYITLIGWLIAYFAMHQSKKTSLGSYHLRQTLLLFICAIVYQIVVYIITMAVPFVGLILSIGGLAFLVLWIMGLIAAINGEEKPMPLIGEKAQELFKSI
ncbi:MAG: hypothetical protein IPF72_05755 [Chitinophagaceae bacterium]|nr:hypothetical protein [Chitinophagaceae bacterium]